MRKIAAIVLPLLASSLITVTSDAQTSWSSKHVSLSPEGRPVYHAMSNGDRLPDFSTVGYFENRQPLPTVPVLLTIDPVSGDNLKHIQTAIDSMARLPLKSGGFRGALLLRKGVYPVSGTLRVEASGIVLRGEGDETLIKATAATQHTLLIVSGTGSVREKPGTRTRIVDERVPVGATSFEVADASQYHVGDSIVLFRPASKNWLADIKMDQITPRDSSIVQWTPEQYGLSCERIVRAIEGKRIFIDSPVMMALEQQYGGGEIYQFSWPGRIRQVGVENILFESAFASNEDEQHGWTALYFNRIENAWARNITSKYFGFSCVNLGYQSRNITVTDCRSLDPKSQITGGRRYSFNNDGQLNLVMNCFASFGRHDYVTGARVYGPNVFYNCRSENAQADIGPHQRWAVGTLYDNIVTDGEINVQDRGNWGTGHGWAGVTQIIWNCKASGAAIQNPWTSGFNFAIGFKGKKLAGRLKDRPAGEWEGLNKAGLQPASLYQIQLNEAKR